MAKLSELIKCLEDGGEVQSTVSLSYYKIAVNGKLYNSRAVSSVVTSGYLDLSNLANGKYTIVTEPKEVTFRAWMNGGDIHEGRCRDLCYVDFENNNEMGSRIEVEITIKEVR